MKKLAVLLALLMVLAAFPSPTAALAVNTDYAETLFDHGKLIEIDIRMDDEAWDNMIATASDEVYSACDVVVNGVMYENVAIRPKGNSSMSSVTRRGSERYSWRIKFDKYEKGRTCDGLDILILNNGFNDPGEFSEALAYDMYAFLEADASLYNYAIVYHNGEYFGVYLALEAVDESFAERNYGEDYGKLYKPDVADRGGAARQQNNDQQNDAREADGEDGGFGGSFGGRNSEASGEQNGEASSETRRASAEAPEGEQEASAEATEGEQAASAEPTEGEQAASAEPTEGEQTERRSRRASGEQNEGASREMGGGFGGGFGGGSNSSLAMALNYVGDDLDAYQGIWDAEKFKSDDEDHARVVEALKHVCQGEDFETYLDLDNVLKYFAIQTFIYNRDGLTGTVSHNYYLYEEDGKLNLIPWDMNESFSMSGNGSAYVNFPIDTPFTGDLSQRTFFMALLGDEECLVQYHEYLRRLSEEYVRGGAFEETYDRLRSQIDELIRTDPTSFTTYENFDSTAQKLKLAIELRAESVLGQLAGDIPSTRDGQSAEPDRLLDTSELAELSGSGEMRR